MSAPLVVNTVDGTCWTRREAVRDGQPLYAMADCRRCPELVMATYAELEDRGIAGSADVLPVPAGSVKPPSELDRMRLRVDEVERAYTFDTAALKRRIDGLEAERRSTNEWVDDAAEALRASRDRIAELEAQRERRRLRLIALQNDALSMRGSLSPMGEDRKVPFPLGETLTPAVDWLIARVAELEALTPARHQTCRVCGAGYVFGEPCAQCVFRARMAAESQARVRLPRRLSHDLPETGGA